MNEIKKCAVIVYDISLDKNQITEAYIALESNKHYITLYLNIKCLLFYFKRHNRRNKFYKKSSI